jgi:hypothetical protein
MNRTDTWSVMIVDLIYSPSDTPKGLWRGFAFIGPPGGDGDAC